MRLYFYSGFNNYYNRKVKKFNTIQEYQDYLIYIINNISFDPKDGINTTQIVPTRSIIDNQAFISETPPDYAILCEDNGDIVSRWFVLQWERKCKGQYNASLKRDVIADNFENIIEAPVFIEKATITDKTDVAIFNNENMGFNQIKVDEDLLQDDYYGDCPWIVGYLPSNANLLVFDEDNDQIIVKGEYAYDTTCQYTPDASLWRVTDMHGSLIKKLDQMPFKMFCMPYGTLKMMYRTYDTDNNNAVIYNEFETNKNAQLTIAQAIAPSLGSDLILDVQILPYCPIRSRLVPRYDENEVKYFDIDSAGYRHEFIYPTTSQSAGQEIGVIFWCETNKFTFDIPYSLPVPDTALEKKVKNETEMYRLCSPNYSGQFEFNPMKNNGVTKFNVDCMYQPYNPYIHINPDFNGLYGTDYNDARGLICTGDFSLPNESNAWANYQLQNKNYQEIFNRQIQDMEINNSIALQQEGYSRSAGVLQAAAAGAAGGAVAGSLVPVVGTAIGALVGGVGGAAASFFGSQYDADMLVAKQREAINYAKDNFGYQLGNIKALPNSISKTNPFINNNKLFPIIEKYSCTNEEIDALKNKLKYNGMTVMRIGKISDWLLDDYSYIKGQLIMLEDINEEYHTLTEIAQEFNNGIRAKKEEA